MWELWIKWLEGRKRLFKNFLHKRKLLEAEKKRLLEHKGEREELPGSVTGEAMERGTVYV